MQPADVQQVVSLQVLAFPPPFSEDLHWDPEHLHHHVETFAEGQFVAVCDGSIVGSCSNTIISEDRWLAHLNWAQTVGGPFIRFHDLGGTTLYGLDITVHPAYRRQGVGGAFYQARYELVRKRNLVRYGTGCRLPDYKTFVEAHGDISVSDYACLVVDGKAVDRTLTPLLRYGLTYKGIVENYMEDQESGNAGALLEWLR